VSNKFNIIINNKNIIISIIINIINIIFKSVSQQNPTHIFHAHIPPCKTLNGWSIAGPFPFIISKQEQVFDQAGNFNLMKSNQIHSFCRYTCLYMRERRRERPERTWGSQEGGQLPFEVTSLQIRSQMNAKLHQDVPCWKKKKKKMMMKKGVPLQRLINGHLLKFKFFYLN